MSGQDRERITPEEIEANRQSIKKLENQELKAAFADLGITPTTPKNDGSSLPGVAPGRSSKTRVPNQSRTSGATDGTSIPVPKGQNRLSKKEIQEGRKTQLQGELANLKGAFADLQINKVPNNAFFEALAGLDQSAIANPQEEKPEQVQVVPEEPELSPQLEAESPQEEEPEQAGVGFADNYEPSGIESTGNDDSENISGLPLIGVEFLEPSVSAEPEQSLLKPPGIRDRAKGLWQRVWGKPKEETVEIKPPSRPFREKLWQGVKVAAHNWVDNLKFWEKGDDKAYLTGFAVGLAVSGLVVMTPEPVGTVLRNGGNFLIAQTVYAGVRLKYVLAETSLRNKYPDKIDEQKLSFELAQLKEKQAKTEGNIQSVNLGFSAALTITSLTDMATSIIANVVSLSQEEALQAISSTPAVMDVPTPETIQPTATPIPATPETIATLPPVQPVIPPSADELLLSLTSRDDFALQVQSAVGANLDRVDSLAREVLSSSGVNADNLSAQSYERVRTGVQELVEGIANESYAQGAKEAVEAGNVDVSTAAGKGRAILENAIGLDNLSNYQELVQRAGEAIAKNQLLQATTPADLLNLVKTTEVSVLPGTHEGQILLENGHRGLSWGTREMFETLGAQGAVNHDNFRLFWEQTGAFFPVKDLGDWKVLVDRAIAGDESAIEMLYYAHSLIIAGKKINVVDIGDINRVLQLIHTSN